MVPDFSCQIPTPIFKLHSIGLQAIFFVTCITQFEEPSICCAVQQTFASLFYSTYAVFYSKS